MQKVTFEKRRLQLWVLSEIETSGNRVPPQSWILKKKQALPQLPVSSPNGSGLKPWCRNSWQMDVHQLRKMVKMVWPIPRFEDLKKKSCPWSRSGTVNLRNCWILSIYIQASHCADLGLLPSSSTPRAGSGDHSVQEWRWTNLIKRPSQHRNFRGWVSTRMDILDSRNRICRCIRIARI